MDALKRRYPPILDTNAMRKLFKYGLIGLVAVIILLLVAIPFLPADQYRPEIERKVSQALGMDVVLGELAFVTIPQPGVSLSGLTITDQGRHFASIDSLQLHPRLSSLFSEKPELRLLKLSGVRIRPADIARLIDTTSSDSSDGDQQRKGLFIQKISADSSYLILEQDELEEWGPLQFDVDFHADFDLVRDQSLS